MNIKKVNRPKGHNRFCGPAVISALTGITTNDAAALFREVSGRPSIKGTYTWEMFEALKRCGMWGVGVTPNKKMTLAAWFKHSYAKRKAGKVFLVSAGNHWQLVSGRRFVCGKTVEVVGLDHDKVARRAVVKAVWLLGGEAKKPKLAKTPAPDRATRLNRADMAKARKLAKAHDIEIERLSPDCWMVYPPDSLDEDDDPFRGDHSCYDDHDVLCRVKEYAAIL